jgi:hypothetical protein
MLIRMNNYDYDKIGISNIAKKYVKIMNDYCDSGM